MEWVCRVFFLFVMGCSTVLASDTVREGRIAEQISKTLPVGQSLRLEAGGGSFLALYSDQQSRFTKGAAIILHDQSAHPDWLEVIHPLRTQLLAHGWRTLSLQMPIAAGTAPAWVQQGLIVESFPRIDAAVAHLRQEKISNIVLIGHGLGAQMGVAYLAKSAPKEIRAFVAIGLAADSAAGEQGVLAEMKQIKLPFMDLYGERDFVAVRDTAFARATAASSATNKAYRQVEYPGADHFFRGLDDLLVAQVYAWLGRVAPGTAITR